MHLQSNKMKIPVLLNIYIFIHLQSNKIEIPVGFRSLMGFYDFIRGSSRFFFKEKKCKVNCNCEVNFKISLF